MPASARRAYQQLFRDLYKLSKGKLSLIVMSTAAGGFVLGSGETVDVGKLSWTCLGTLACSAAANTCNQIYEIQSDALMKRTALRPMPAGRLSVPAALAFAAVTGVGGAMILQSQVCHILYSWLTMYLSDLLVWAPHCSQLMQAQCCGQALAPMIIRAVFNKLI